jgi:gluconate 2-dehydrogenase gamma chain
MMKYIRRHFFYRILLKVAALGLLGRSGTLFYLAHAQENVGELAEGCKFFNGKQAKTLQAITDEIIPPDDFAGGKDAGVLYFIDSALARWDESSRWDYVTGLEGVNESSQILFRDDFANLSSEQKIQVLRGLESGEAPGQIWSRFELAENRGRGTSSQRFFNLLVRHSMQGYYGDPEYGGNKDRQSWTMIGYVAAPHH